MKKLISIWIVVLAAVTAVLAQDPSQKRDTPPPQPKVAYRLDFKVYEMEDGKRSNQREYTLLASARTTGGYNAIHVGTRVPVSLEEKKTTYMNVGLDLSVRLTHEDSKLWGNFEIKLDGLVLPDQNVDTLHGNPILRNTQSSVETSIVPGKPLVITSIDDVNSKKRLIVEVTATKID
ncbi:MAG TPA: hypothetical protein VEW69_09645 [Alphaproteobacteria bacterium]|nr:hypothetical protein [Alphaproteobacteria bacterium]